MRILDVHFHWWPRAVMNELGRRSGFPRTEPNDRGGYKYWFREEEGKPHFSLGPEWNDLDNELAHMAGTRRDFDVLCSTGPFSVFFGELPAAESRDLCQIWNDEMARAQSEHPGRVWASAVVPLQDTAMAIDELDRAVRRLNLVAVNLPGSIGRREYVDEPRLEPFYDRVEELGIPVMLHPTDAAFLAVFEGYNGALYSSLGRVVDVSASAFRLVLSGIMERHPDMKVFMSHTGGALPYQAGRMDKNARIPGLPEKPSTYIKRMYTDTVSPHSLGVKFAIDYYGADRVMYGDDYPCWNPESSLDIFEEVTLSAEDRESIYSGNARRVFGLRTPVEAQLSA
jgi:aminocarboxymuconate-semialdehyde decarboxylase